MGLKQMLTVPFEPEQPNSSKDMELLKELSDRLAMEQQKNAELTSTIPTLRSENQGLKSRIPMLLSTNQEMLSKLTTQQEQIELLTERASNVNKIEQMNENLQKLSREAETKKDRALQEAQFATERARYEEERARDAEQRRDNANRERYEAGQAAREAQNATRRMQGLYRSLFIGWGAFTAVLAFLNAWERRIVFREIGQWWIDRWINIVSIGRGIGTVFVWLSMLLGNWGVPEPWGYMIAAAMGLALLTGLFFLGKRVARLLVRKVHQIKEQYRDGVFKAAMSAATSLGLFFICLWFYGPLRIVWPFNIFSLWLIIAVIGVIAWNFREIKEGLTYA